MELNKIAFNDKYLSLIKDLTGISPSIIFTKVEESTAGDPPSTEKRIVVLRTNKSKSIFFRVTAPEDSFIFDGEKIAFYNFMEFYSLMTVFKLSGLYHFENSIIIESDIGKVNYVLTEPESESMNRSPSRINLADPDVTFTLTSAMLHNIREVNKLVNARYAKMTLRDGKITINLFNSQHQNSFAATFDAIPNPKSTTTELEFSIYSEIFSKLPIDTKGEFFSDYTGSIYNSGFVSFSFNKDKIDLLVGMGMVKKIGDEE